MRTSENGDEAGLTAVEAVKVIEKSVPGIFEVVIQLRRGEKVAYEAVILLPGLGDQGDFDIDDDIQWKHRHIQIARFIVEHIF